MITAKRSPKVSIIGAGPGALDLITLRGIRKIQSADVILYDALVEEELLLEAPAHCQKIFVGKRAGVKCIKQDAINFLLVQSARDYGHAVRLKGGDPYIFGRGHEEKTYVEEHDIPVEIVPGISSSASVPLLSGIPVTLRGVSESFWVLTGSTKEHQLSKDILLAMQSTATLVILMAIRKLPMIVELLKESKNYQSPIMIVQNGSKEDQKVVVGTCNDILEKARDKDIGTPGIIIIGEVVKQSPDFITQKINSEWIKA